jgi:hypothetical protein
MEKLEKLKKSLDNKFIPDNMKDKIRAEIKKLESEIKTDETMTAKEVKEEVKEIEEKVEKALEVAEKKEEIAEAKAEEKKEKAPRKAREKKASTSETKKQKSEPKSTAKKKSVFSLAKEIRKDGESWEEAKKRASKMMKSDTTETKKKVRTETDKLLAMVRRNKEYKKLAGTSDLRKDASRRALPRGKRISKITGKVYYENRANRVDVGGFKNAYLENGGGVDGIIELKPLELIPLSTQLNRLSGYNWTYGDWESEDGGKPSTMPNSVIVNVHTKQKFRLSPFKIYEGIDHYNNKTLYRVEDMSEDGEYVGEWYKTREEAEDELREMFGNSYDNGGSVDRERFNKFISSQINYIISLKTISQKREPIQNLINNMDDYSGEEIQKRITKDNLKYALQQKTVSKINEVLRISLNALKYADGGAILGTPETPLARDLGIDYTGLVGETGAMSSGELFEGGGEIEFEKANLYLVGRGRDINGNKVVKVSFPNQRPFSIQTLGNLPKTHRIFREYDKNEDITPTDVKTIEDEIVAYIEEFGSKKQKQSLKKYAEKGVYVETLEEEIDLSDDGKPRVKRTQEGSNKSFGELREIHGASPEALAYAEGGSLGNHGLKQGDQIIKTMSGGVQKVKTRTGDIVYVNLANGYRGAEPPLPFDNGGSLKKQGRYSILGEVDKEQPVLYATTDDRSRINSLVDMAEIDFYELTGKKHNIIVTDEVTDDEVYNFDKGGRTRERKYVNYSQKHEVRYSKDKPHRRGYGYAEGGVTKNYINRNELNTITIKKGDQKLTYKVSDVYNGAYKLENGGNLEKMDFYVPKRNVVKVQLRSGKDVKVANGYWIKKGAKPIHTSKYDDGGRVDKHEDWEMIVVSKELNKDGGKYFKDRFLVSAKNIEQAKELATNLWYDMYGKDTDLSIVKVMSESLYELKYFDKYDDGGMTQSDFMKKEIESQREKEKGKTFKDFKVNVYEQSGNKGAYPFVEPHFTDNFVEALNFAKETIKKQRNYRSNSGVLWATIDSFTPIEKRQNVRYAYDELVRVDEEDINSSKYDDGGQLEIKFSGGGFTNWRNYPNKKVLGFYKIKGTEIDVQLNLNNFERYDDETYSLYPTEENRKYFKSIKVKSSALNRLSKGLDVKGETNDGKLVTIKRLKDLSFDGGGKTINNEPKEEDLITNVGKYGSRITKVTDSYVEFWDNTSMKKISCKKSDLVLNNIDDDGDDDGYYEDEPNSWICKKTSYAGGGKTTFKEKATAIAKNFEGKKVEPKYQKEYGKVYDKAEAKEVGNKIAGSQKAKYDSKMSGGGSTKRKPKSASNNTMVLAKQIRKDGESWQSAMKRAKEQIAKK